MAPTATWPVDFAGPTLERLDDPCFEATASLKFMTSEVAVLLYPGCIFFEVALAAETLAARLPVRCYTPTGEPLNR